MELYELLERAGAPKTLSQWVDQRAPNIDVAWEACDNASWRMWLAAAAGAPLEILVDASVQLARRNVEPLQTQGLIALLDVATPNTPLEDLRTAVKHCEEWSANRPQSYREKSHRDAAVESATTATLFAARALEAFKVYTVHAELRRLEHARQQGAMVGISAVATIPADDGVLRMNLPIDSNEDRELESAIVSACAESAQESIAAIRATESTEEARIAAAITLDRELRELLEE